VGRVGPVKSDGQLSGQIQGLSSQLSYSQKRAYLHLMEMVSNHRQAAVQRHGLTLPDKGISRPGASFLPERRVINISFFGTRPVEEGKILCYTPQHDAIRWIVYEIWPTKGRCFIPLRLPDEPNARKGNRPLKCRPSPLQNV